MSRPYLTPTELTNAPTGVNWSSIPEVGATTQQQLAEQQNLINRASRFIESYCAQKLYATTDQEVLQLPGHYARMMPDGTITVVTKFSPVITMQLIEFSGDGQTWTALPWNTQPLAKAMTQILPGSRAEAPAPYSGIIRSGWLRLTYIDGFPNAVTTANANQGDTALTVDDATGFMPGQYLTLYDGETTEESVQVVTSYTPVTGVVGQAVPDTVALAAPLANAHAAGAHLTGLHDDVREAAIMAAVHYARMRGRDTISISSAGGTRQVMAVSQVEELDEARDILAKSGLRRLI